MPVRTVIWPPRANPKVTAGLTWPPDMLAPTATATKRAKPWQIATATNPAGSRAAPDVNFPVKQTRQKKKNQNFVEIKSSIYIITKTDFVICKLLHDHNSLSLLEKLHLLVLFNYIRWFSIEILG